MSTQCLKQPSNKIQLTYLLEAREIMRNRIKRLGLTQKEVEKMIKEITK